MNELHVRAEQLVFVEHFDAAKSFDLSERTAGVLGDRQPYAASKFPFLPVNLGRSVAGAARREAHRQQAVVRYAEPFLLNPSDVVEVGGLFRFLLQIAAVAVRKPRANAGVAERA